MAAATAASSEEVSELMMQLMGAFNGRQDASLVQEIEAKHRKVLDSCQLREAKMKEIIQGLLRDVAKAQEDVAKAEPHGAHDERVHDLEHAMAQTLERIGAMAAEAEKLEAHRKGLEQAATALQERRAWIEDVAKKEMPRVLYELSLYAHISRIHWDPEAEDRARGFISVPEASDVRKFDLDPAALSEFELSSSLWELIA